MTRRLFRILTGTTVALTMLTTLIPSARADESDTTRGGDKPIRIWQQAAEVATTETPSPKLEPAASSEENTGLARINGYRARSGVPAVTLVGAPGAVVNHAKYLNTNINVSGLDPFTEVPSLPGYTATGAAIADQTWPAASVTGTYAQIVDEWLADPESQYFALLDPSITSIAFTRQGSVVLAWVKRGPDLGGYPIAFPQGQNFSLGTMPMRLSAYYTQGCTAASWGFPITFQFDPNIYGDMWVNSVDVRVDGSRMAVCPVNNHLALATQGLVVLIPAKPLSAGSSITATTTATAFHADDSGSTIVTASTTFTMQAAVTTTPGDQTGDRTADILAVTNAGNLMLYKGLRPGTIGHGFQVGRGWNEFTWFSHTGDVNGDGREDMIGRRRDGHLYLYYGRGMGSYSAGRKVGQNWNGLRNLTVVGDMNGDGTPEVIGISATGNLHRYTLMANGFVGATIIGKNWQNIALTTSVGSFNKNDHYADLIAVGTNGNLHAYYVGKGGVIIQAAQIGRGWTGFTALFSPGDLNGDGRPDLVGRNAAGTMYSYQNNLGSWSAARQAGTNWNTIRLFG